NLYPVLIKEEALRFILDVLGVLITARWKASFLLCGIPAKQKILPWRPWRLGGFQVRQTKEGSHYV
ncbi:MAG: hypothetical protein K9J48_05145, partial [Desulfohalobiaceae bacterium]|nr:hypothetical protein [Desulfohalobiaceae bacterium]